MKRLFSLIIALVLVLSLGSTAFATGNVDSANGTITITNATVGKEYSVFKIFDATVKGDHTTYSIKPEDPFFADLFGADGKTPNDYFVYHASTEVITRKDETNTEDGNKALIEYLTGLVAGKTATAGPTEATSDTVTFENLDYGYYVITSTLGAVVTIHEVKPTAEVIDKNQKTTVLDKMIYDEDSQKWVKASSSNVGDIIEFMVTFTATNYDGETKIEKYTITDTLSSAWANINTSSIVVKVGDETLSADAFTVDPVTANGVTTGFTLEIPWVENDADKTFKYDSTATVVITYEATVLAAAASTNPANQNNQNHVTSDWDPTGDQTTTKVYNLGFTKVDGTDSSKTLPGAIFELYSDATCTSPVYVKATATNGVYIVDPTSQLNKVETPEGGQVVIMGLEAGTYYLKETKAPDGYNPLTDAREVIVGGDVTPIQMVIDTTAYTVNNAQVTIVNNSGMELPSTGGAGTMMLISIGTMVAMAFAVLLITHKKMSVYRD